MPKAKPNKKDAAKLFLKDVLSKVPEDKRASVEEALSADDALDLLGEGVLRQSDYSRQMDEAREDAQRSQTLYEENVKWRAENKVAYDAALVKAQSLEAENKRFRQALANGGALDFDPDAPDPAHRPTGTPPEKLSYSREELDEMLRKQRQELETGGITLMSRLSKVSTRHLKDYGEVLDTDALIEFSTKNRLDLEAGYREFTAEKAQARDTEAQKKRDEELISKTRQDTIEEIRRANPVLPHLVGNNEPSIREQLKADKKEFGAKAAIDEFYRTQPR